MEFTKRNIITVIDPYLEIHGGITIQALRKKLDQVELLGATHIEIDANEEYGSVCIYSKATMVREETDEEFEKRKRETIDHVKRSAEMHKMQLANLEKQLKQWGEA